MEIIWEFLFGLFSTAKLIKCSRLSGIFYCFYSILASEAFPDLWFNLITLYTVTSAVLKSHSLYQNQIEPYSNSCSSAGEFALRNIQGNLANLICRRDQMRNCCCFVYSHSIFQLRWDCLSPLLQQNFQCIEEFRHFKVTHTPPWLHFLPPERRTSQKRHNCYCYLYLCLERSSTM